jgi:hypothetical protein
MVLREAADDFLLEATGRAHRDDAVLERSGGPAGNARLTAWTGLILLPLFLVELVTLLSLDSLLSWHIVVGVLLIPPSLVKTGSTAWRIVRYYAGNQPYRTAGPPPIVLRLLGPLVVLSTLAVLGSGLALILVSPDSARNAWVTVGGFGIGVLMLHKASFVVWAAATGVHTLGRLVPALRLTVIPAVSRRIPGRAGRTAMLAVTVVIAVVGATLALSAAGPWRTSHHDHRPGYAQPR